MIYIDDISNKEKLSKVLKEKNVFFRKIDKSKILKKIIYSIIFLYMNLFSITIKKIVKIEDDGIEINLIYLISKNEIKISNIKKVIKFIKKNHCKNIVLSNSLKNNSLIKNNIYASNLNILDGKFLYESLVYKMLEYISSVQKEKMEKYEISILINNKTEARVLNILNIIKKCKVVNIITNNIKQFESIQNDMEENYGIIVNVTSNTNKSLAKSNIIINYDFIAEKFSKCIIPKHSIIINIGEEIKYYSNNFSGVNITDYMIYKPDKYKKIFKALSNFDICIVYESILYYLNLTQKEIFTKINRDNVNIRYFIGNNDKIKGIEILNTYKQTYVSKKRGKSLDKIK